MAGWEVKGGYVGVGRWSSQCGPRDEGVSMPDFDVTPQALKRSPRYQERRTRTEHLLGNLNEAALNPGQ